MPTLLLPPRITEDSIRLWRAAVAAGWETLRLDRWKAPEGIAPEDVVVYGGYFVAVARELGISLLVPRVDWLARLPRELTGRKVRFMSLAEARRLTDRAFYKPSDDKCFLAKVYAGGHELPPAGELPDDVPVLVSEVVPWETEFRCFVLDGKCVALSPYLRNGQRLETESGEFPASDAELNGAREFVGRVLAVAGATIPPGVVIDIGTMKNRGWGVIEANQAWGAGIYGCDPAAVLPVLRRVCVATATLTEPDHRWAANL